MQARDTHQVGHPGGTEHVPVGPLDGLLVTYQQGRHHPGSTFWGRHLTALARAQALPDGVAHPLAQLLHRELPGLPQALGHGVVAPGAHRAQGLHTLLPQPQLVVKAARVAQAVGGFQAQPHAPAFTGPQRVGHGSRRRAVLRGTLCIGQLPPVPAHIDQAGQLHGPPLQLGRLHHQPQAQARRMALRHAADDAGHQHVPPFQRRWQHACREHRGPQPAQAPGHQRSSQHHNTQPHRRRTAHMGPHPADRGPRQHGQHIHRHAGQRGLLQLQGAAQQHPPASAQQPAVPLVGSVGGNVSAVGLHGGMVEDRQTLGSCSHHDWLSSC